MSIPSPLPDTASSLFVRRLRLQAKIGDLGASDWNFRKQTMINEDPQAVQQDTVQLGAYVLGKTYSIRLLGFLVSYVATAADADLAGVAISFAARINADPNLRGQVSAAADGNDVDTAGNQPGFVYTLTAVVETTIVSVQSATSASEIPFGRMVLHKGYSTVAHRAASQLGRLADSNAFTGQTDTVTVTLYDAASTYIVEVLTDDGYLAVFVVPANTDESTTAADIRAAIDADVVLAAKNLLTAGAVDGFRLTSSTAGFGFRISVSVFAGAGTIEHTVDDYSISTSLLLARAGVSILSYDGEAAARESDITVHLPNEPLDVLTDGLIWVELDGTEAAPTFGGAVYVDLTPGDTAGRFYTVIAAGRVLLVGALWERGANNGTDLIGQIKVRF